MVTFPIDTGIRKVADSILTPLARDSLEEWFSEDITVLLSKTDVLATLVVDFAFSVSSLVQFTLDGGANFISFNNGEAVVGGQSRFIDVTTGVQVNFRAIAGGTLIRCIVSSVP